MFVLYNIHNIIYEIKLFYNPKNNTQDNQIQVVEKKIHLFKLALE